MLPLEKMLDVQLLMRDKKSFHTANIFGFIAYSDRNPYIVKVLRDNDFWRSLNARTEGWILYAVKPDSEYYAGGNAEFINKSLRLMPEDYPQLILLSIGSNGVMMQKNYHISDESVDVAYKSIECIVETVTQSVSNIFPEYRQSTNVSREVIKALDAELLRKEWRKVTKGLYDFVLSLISLHK